MCSRLILSLFTILVFRGCTSEEIYVSRTPGFLISGLETLEVGSQAQLTASLFDFSGQKLPPPISIKWESSDSAILSVRTDGTILAKSTGQVTVTATTIFGDHTLTQKISITVLDPPPIQYKLDIPKTIILKTKETTPIPIRVTDDQNNPIRINYQNLQIQIKGEGLVVSLDLDNRGVSAIAGTDPKKSIEATFTYTTDDGKIIEANIRFTIVTDPKANILGPNTLEVGDSVNLRYTFTDQNGERANPDSHKWISSDEKIASIDSQSGLLTAHKEGSITVTLETTFSGNQVEPVSLTIIVSNTIEPESFTFKINDCDQPRKIRLGPHGVSLSYSFLDSQGNDIENPLIRWDIEQYRLVLRGIEVGNDLKLTPLIPGKSKVIAKTVYQGKLHTASCDILVYGQPIFNVSPTSLTLKVDEEKSIGYTFTDENGTPSTDKLDITWTSGDLETALVRDGNVRGLKIGTTKITISITYLFFDETFTESKTITVKVVQEYTKVDLTIVDPPPKIWIEGSPIDLDYALTNEKGESISIAEEVIWEVSNDLLADVNDSGVLTGKKYGEVIVTIQTTYRGEVIRDVATISVVHRPRIKLNPPEEVRIGETFTIDYDFYGENGALADPKPTLQWSSKSKDIFDLVNPDKGTFQGKSLGQGILSAEYPYGPPKPLEETITIVVIQKPKLKIEGPSPIVLQKGDTHTLKVVYQDKHGSEQPLPLNTRIVWESNDSSVEVTDRNQGSIKGISTGNTTVTASVVGDADIEKDSIDVRVVNNLVDAIRLTFRQEAIIIKVNETKSLRDLVDFRDETGSEKKDKLRWKKEPQDASSIDLSFEGLVLGKTPGSLIVTVIYIHQGETYSQELQIKVIQEVVLEINQNPPEINKDEDEDLDLKTYHIDRFEDENGNSDKSKLQWELISGFHQVEFDASSSKVIPRNLGRAKIRVWYGDKADIFTITVVQNPIFEITNPSPIQIVKGASPRTINTRYTDKHGVVEHDPPITINTENKGFVSVTLDGKKIKGDQEGQETVTAKMNNPPGHSDTIEVKVETKKVPEKIRLIGSAEIHLYVGQTTAVEFEYRNQKGEVDTLSGWSFSSNDLHTVVGINHAKKQIEGLASGDTTVVLVVDFKDKANKNNTITITVKVHPKPTLSIEGSRKVNKNESAFLTAKIIGIHPQDTATPTYLWALEKPGDSRKMNIGNPDKETLSIRAKQILGPVIIKLEITLAGGVKVVDQHEVTVIQDPVLSIKKKKSPLKVGEDFSFEAEFLDETGNPNKNGIIEWSITLGNQFLTINPKTGKATAKGIGKATIQATLKGGVYDGKTVEAVAFEVDIEADPNLEPLMITSKFHCGIYEDDNSQSADYKSNLYHKDGTDSGKEITPLGTPIWKSSDKSTLEVDQNGKLTPKQKGSAIISLTIDYGGTYGEIKREIEIHVVERPNNQTIREIDNGWSRKLILPDGTHDFDIEIYPSQPDDCGVKIAKEEWTSKSTHITIEDSEKGFIKGKSSGKVNDLQVTVTFSDGEERTITMDEFEVVGSGKLTIITPTSDYVRVGNIISLDLEYEDAKGVKSKPPSVTWSTSSGDLKVLGTGKEATGMFEGINPNKSVTVSVTLDADSKKTAAIEIKVWALPKIEYPGTILGNALADFLKDGDGIPIDITDDPVNLRWAFYDEFGEDASKSIESTVYIGGATDHTDYLSTQRITGGFSISGIKEGLTLIRVEAPYTISFLPLKNPNPQTVVKGEDLKVKIGRSLFPFVLISEIVYLNEKSFLNSRNYKVKVPRTVMKVGEYIHLTYRFPTARNTISDVHNLLGNDETDFITKGLNLVKFVDTKDPRKKGHPRLQAIKPGEFEYSVTVKDDRRTGATNKEYSASVTIKIEP